MSQSLIDLTHLKDRDTAAAVDKVATLMVNAGVPASGVGISGQIAGTNAAAGVIGEFISAAVPTSATTATVTITIAAPGVITWTAHGFPTNAPTPVVFTTSSSLPTGITSGTVYYTVPSTVTTNTFEIATTIANAFAGTAITTSGSQAGTQTGTAGCAMATGTVIDVTGLNLTAGDWDVWAQVVWTAGSTTTTTARAASLSTTAATLATLGAVAGGSQQLWNGTSQTATNGLPAMDVPACQINVSATTSVHLVVQSTFATSTMNASGFIAARRRS